MSRSHQRSPSSDWFYNKTLLVQYEWHAKFLQGFDFRAKAIWIMYLWCKVVFEGLMTCSKLSARSHKEGKCAVHWVRATAGQVNHKAAKILWHTAREWVAVTHPVNPNNTVRWVTVQGDDCRYQNSKAIWNSLAHTRMEMTIWAFSSTSLTFDVAQNDATVWGLSYDAIIVGSGQLKYNIWKDNTRAAFRVCLGVSSGQGSVLLGWSIYASQ